MEPQTTTPIPSQAEPISKQRQQQARLTHKFAWVVEICAVAIGFAIAIMTMAASFNAMEAIKGGGELSFSDYVNMMIAGMPFIMVAFVELAKIPLTQTFYNASHIMWKAIFGFLLLFVALITFESALNGFERNFNALVFGIDKYKKELVNVEEQLVPLELRREKLSELTAEMVEGAFNDRQAAISEQHDKQARIIQTRIDELRASIQTEYVTALKDQLELKRKDLQSIYSERDNEITSLSGQHSTAVDNAATELSTQRRTLQAQLSSENKKLSDMETRAQAEIDDAFVLRKSSVQEKWNAELAPQRALVSELREKLNGLNSTSLQSSLNANFQQATKDVRDRYQRRIDNINQDIRKLNLDISKSLGSREKDIEAIVDRHQKELLALEEQFNAQQNENRDSRRKEHEQLKNNDVTIADLDGQILALQNRRVELRDTINVQVADNQIYRMAQWWWGKESAADIDREDVMTIAALWFGSLALLVAFMGIALELASLVSGDETIPNRKSAYKNKSGLGHAANKLLLTLRRYITYRRKMQRTPIYKTVVKEVIKEVPVDRVVLQEVPVEIIRKELVHVPLYTDDPDLINLDNDGVVKKRRNTKGAERKMEKSSAKAADTV